MRVSASKPLPVTSPRCASEGPQDRRHHLQSSTGRVPEDLLELANVREEERFCARSCASCGRSQSSGAVWRRFCLDPCGIGFHYYRVQSLTPSARTTKCFHVCPLRTNDTARPVERLIFTLARGGISEMGSLLIGRKDHSEQLAGLEPRLQWIARTDERQ